MTPGYKKVTCPECHGTGQNGNCGWCGGSGSVINTDPDGPPTLTCLHCSGSGKEPGRCPYCYGSGQVEEHNIKNKL